ncbi:hypothetical protein [Streptomyces sp. NPDC007355]|uniref:hypothetical protein n=1 Tax=Streptomyces sp. NPDC007355 TaxID=3364778 RepID=UPI00367E540A
MNRAAARGRATTGALFRTAHPGHARGGTNRNARTRRRRSDDHVLPQHHQPGAIARALNRSTGCGYQKALQRVKAAADAGKLPARLDQAGREEAVRLLTENRPQSALATMGVASGPSSDTPPAVAYGMVRGGADKIVTVAPADLVGEMLRAIEVHRNLQNKERTVDAMRAQRDQNLNPFLLPTVPQELVTQVERILEQTRRLSRRDELQ